MKKLKEIRGLLQTVEEEVLKEYRTEIVGLFGSYARGEQRETSDVDVLVKFLKGATLLDLVGVADFLEAKLGVRVDIVPIDTIRNEIKDVVMREAILI